MVFGFKKQTSAAPLSTPETPPAAIDNPGQFSGQQPAAQPSNQASEITSVTSPLAPLDAQQPADATASEDDAMQASAISHQISQALGAVTRVLMSASHTKHFSLADLEWLALPAIMSRQFRLAQMQSADGKIVTPAALIFWARVSDEVDQRLSNHLDTPMRLQPNEWTSGNHIWLIEAAGDPRFIEDMLHGLSRSIGARPIKLRKRGADGKIEAGTWAASEKIAR